ncbi:hypothetical protein FRC02_002769 [Tulasnella sp. 418]|nr:hypothetical protein FRC02_002769 [Tulasnella sp. 418]
MAFSTSGYDAAGTPTMAAASNRPVQGKSTLLTAGPFPVFSAICEVSSQRLHSAANVTPSSGVN